MASTIELVQKEICKKYGVPFFESPDHMIVGISRNVKSGEQPVNGLRHPPQGNTSGWYIWAGEEMSSDPDFFVPLHIVHLKSWCPSALKFLGLPPGWRFIQTGEYEDVWKDPSLLFI
jgi:hypothetical protein